MSIFSIRCSMFDVQGSSFEKRIRGFEDPRGQVKPVNQTVPASLCAAFPSFRSSQLPLFLTSLLSVNRQPSTFHLFIHSKITIKNSKLLSFRLLNSDFWLLSRAIKPSYIAIFRAKNLNIGGISALFQTFLVLIFMGWLGPSPKATTVREIKLRALTEKYFMVLGEAH